MTSRRHRSVRPVSGRGSCDTTPCAAPRHPGPAFIFQSCIRVLPATVALRRGLRHARLLQSVSPAHVLTAASPASCAVPLAPMRRRGEPPRCAHPRPLSPLLRCW